ncbi:GTPase Der [Labeo rohita]|uniref:GTPase Der n=1 Tax=Labeo rohita TaxID=84645 RepID=A0ABQ8MIJ3_LABRO|nr:GTPase Der [Labeo rohita]
MPLGTLRSRAAFFSKKPRRSSSASRSGPSTSGYEAVAMCVEEERQVLSEVLPVASSQTAHPVCLPIESPDDFESSSQYGLDLLFGAPAEEKAASVASEGEPSEADVTTEFAAPAVESQSVADAEMAAALQRAAKEIGVAWVPPPSPEPSRLDDWFLGRGRDSKPRSSPVPFFPEVHEELTKSWKAPLSARSRYANSPSLTTLDGGPARGYSEVPQVERAVAMHLCPQNAASWRGRPRLPSRACKFSSALVAKAYAASGQAASALHALHLFSRCRTGLGRHVCTSLPGACTVSSEMRGNAQVWLSGPPKTGSEAPRAHGILSRGHAVGFDAHETAAALAPYPSPQEGVAPRHVPCEHHTIVPPDTQPLDGHRVPSVRSALGTGVQTRRCHHGRFQDRLGCHLQRAGSFRGLGRPPAALAHQLSGVVGSASSSEEVLAYDSEQARVGQVGQHGDSSLHQPPGRCTFLSHVTTSPPPPALEPTQTQVLTGHSHSGRCQSSGRFSVTTGFARRRVEAPPSVGSTDLGSIRPGASGSLRLTGIHPLPVVVRADRGSPRYRCTGTQLAEGPAQVCVSPGESDRTNFVQSQGGQGAGPLGSPLLAQQNLVLGPGSPGVSSSLAHSPEEGPPFPGEGHNLAPAPDLWNLHLWPLDATRRTSEISHHQWRAWTGTYLPRHLRFMWPLYRLIMTWWVAGRSVGKHDLVIRFLRGARRLNPPRPHLIPSWDLAVVLRGLQQGPFEPLQSVKLDALSLKTALLTALASVKRVGDLQALSINSSCLEFGPADSHVVLRPRPGYVPKVPTTPFRDQVVTLQAISSQEDDPNLTLLCPVRALRIYLERTQPFRRSEQLFVCYGGQQKGKAVSKQRISHWLVDAIRVAYQARGLPCPLEVRAHSTRGVAASAALANGASLTDICRAAACFKALPLTVITLLSFSRFPSVNPGHHLHHWHLWTWQSFAEGLATGRSQGMGLSLVVSPGVSPTSAPMFNVVTCTPPVGQVVNSVAPFFLRGGGAFPTLARHSAALLRKARLQNPGTGQSWTLDGHGGGELHFVNTLPVTSALITRDAASKVAVFYGDP